MDIFTLLSYVNKVSLLAFFIITAVVGYQIYIIRKEKTRSSRPSIPDFKDLAKPGQLLNFTQLPSSLTKEETKKVSYSGLIFSIISLLTVVVIIFIVFLIKRNSSQTTYQASTLNNSKSQSGLIPTIPVISVVPTIFPTPSLSPTPSPESTGVVITPTLSLTSTVTPSPSPTEIILAEPTNTGTVVQQAVASSTPALNNVTSLPVTGSVGKGLILFGTAVTTIVLSFWL